MLWNDFDHCHRMKQHISDPRNDAALLVFPEGTCVNNEYTVLFHRGAFDLDAIICPVAVKYECIIPSRFVVLIAFQI
jgi:glycerol-3-phosphate O-acyltransferase 3/4